MRVRKTLTAICRLTPGIFISRKYVLHYFMCKFRLRRPEEQGSLQVAIDEQERQNITLSLPRGVVREAKVIAAQRGTSISALMARVLRELIDEERGYRAARERSLRRLEDGFDLGTSGKARWTRDELHER